MNKSKSKDVENILTVRSKMNPKRNSADLQSVIL